MNIIKERNLVAIVASVSLMMFCLSCTDGKKLEVNGTSLTFRIGEVVVNDSSIDIPLLTDAAIPMKKMGCPVEMRIMVDGLVIESSNIGISGMFNNASTQQVGLGGSNMKFEGHFIFTFPTTKVPDKIIVYNNATGKSVNFSGKSIKTNNK